ncbi:pentatricopeptide repeat-containing protein At5g65570 [Phoenix dactylifera]|uniref:Pentatricopeptide repeat-containing protein At5g65570 n=1 Tax=Phoenix dactylifera TaxID=42345 RepID=A0A8B9AII4_PHODC|nr:pentatricopeptide repeat-containing protein At5g65570 [Phoenix dactylifera]XP_017697227.1 pentatricopeptide repeat-containing protein At5g65570 [Phoenix dactylifera]XP_026658484.1 pentatricopeptide repeat-containing protein At5g65570 [Phoenix dactylifera]XP_026658485.1 pentatricopeptide repeat-containing protein At5g65570 [Phoenix dactylifera]XP_026658487.1 pentatricopeptide repeat-containing protein At5g65570 [Phoenix dactylifera]XP_026658490.1 pentatricopeptide repeat-containing protein A
MRVLPFTNTISPSILSTLIKTLHTSAANPPPIPSYKAFDSYASLLRRCAAEKSIVDARRVHLHMKKAGFPYLSLGNKLVDAYLKCGAIDNAREVFDEMPKPHIVLWNAMISSYTCCRRSKEAIFLFRRMLSEGFVADEFTFSSILRAFSDLLLIAEGRGAHGRLVVLGLEAMNAFVGSALVAMYAKFGRLRDARAAYDRISDKDVVLATALIVGCTQNGEDGEAICLFGDMVNSGIKPNEFTFASVLIACGNLRELRKGMVIHGVMVKSGFESGNSSQTSLITMYSKCGHICDSLKVFRQTVNPNVVTWTAIIGCLACNQREELALSMFRSMVRDSVCLNAFTLSTVLQGCSALALFEQGKLIHACAIKIGLDTDSFVGSMLVDTYGKCGRVGMAKLVFDSLPGCDLVLMNSMINAYAQNGHGLEAVGLFDLMQDLGLEPDDATLTCVLSACSNAGLVDEGRRIFSFITNKYSFGPSNDHYACMVDLLGYAGRLKEAEELITRIKKPDKVLWRTLLGACKIHGEVEMAKRAARKVLEIDPSDAGTYILLSNIFASLGQWNEVISMKSAMRHMKLKKDPAMSWIEVDREVHTFMAGDKSHPQAEEIYKELEGLIERTKGLGYVPNTRFVLQELDELEKERSLYYHSEKLAVAFGVLSVKGKGNPSITIFKNLRVCGDCHAWIKLVAQDLGKEIIARDAKRFHHFRDGLCSCQDYW